MPTESWQWVLRVKLWPSMNHRTRFLIVAGLQLDQQEAITNEHLHFNIKVEPIHENLAFGMKPFREENNNSSYLFDFLFVIIEIHKTSNKIVEKKRKKILTN